MAHCFSPVVSTAHEITEEDARIAEGERDKNICFPYYSGFE